MSITPVLQTQVDALRARMTELSKTATAEDCVMLAKAVEAIGGQITVFDLMDQTKVSGDDALQAIKTEKEKVLAEITAAAGIGDALKAEHVSLQKDIAGIVGRTDVLTFPLPAGGGVLPDATKGVYLLQPVDYTAASVTIPDYDSSRGHLLSHLLVNDSDLAIRILDSAGHACGSIAARGFSIVYLTGTAGSYAWHVGSSAPGSQSIIVNSPLIMLDTSATSFLTVTRTSYGFLIGWARDGNNYALCRVRWVDNELVADAIQTVSLNYAPSSYAARHIQMTDTQIVICHRYDTNRYIYGYVCTFDAATQTWSLGSRQQLTQSTGTTGTDYFSVSRINDTTGAVSFKFNDGTNSYRKLNTFTISGSSISKSSEVKFDGGTTSSGWSSNNIGIDSADVRGAYSADVQYAYGASNTYQTFLSVTDITTTPPVRKVSLSTFGTNDSDYSGICVKWVRDDLILGVWYNSIVQATMWKLYRYTAGGSKLTMQQSGSFPFFGNRSWEIHGPVLVVLNDTQVAYITTGLTSYYPKIRFGEINTEGTGMTWGDAIDLPFTNMYSGYVHADYDPVRKALAIVTYASNVTPLLMTVKL